MGTLPFKLVWFNRDETHSEDLGEYASIEEAGADLGNAKKKLQAKYPRAKDPHFPHDIEAGQWRVVPNHTAKQRK